MELLNAIPAPIWGLIALAFAFWYVFMRGKRRKTTKRTLNQLKRQDEAAKRELNIARNREKIEEIAEKKRKKKADWLK